MARCGAASRIGTVDEEVAAAEEVDGMTGVSRCATCGWAAPILGVSAAAVDDRIAARAANRRGAPDRQ
jgi:hypothetical protein